MNDPTVSNEEVSKVLEEIAEYLEYQDANEYRVSAYRKAADSIQTLDESVAEIVNSDDRSLENIPHVGSSLAGTITDYVHKGRSSQLERLKGEVDPAELIAGVPGIGEELAERIVSAYDIASLEELEMAAHDGRLEKIEGIGDNKLQGIRDSLNSTLSRSSHRRARKLQRFAAGEEVTEPSEPPVSMLLDVDEEYREKASKDELKTIAPKRFNPGSEKWLPILHTERKEWYFTVLFSNTQRAHDLNKTHDWVVIYYEQNGEEDQCTVVTREQGTLKGKRIIRGREKECREYYKEKM